MPLASRATSKKRSFTVSKQYRRSYGDRDRKCYPYSYVLVVAEKPKAASRIAAALSPTKPLACRAEGVVYWVVERKNGIYVVAPAAGHLFGLTTDKNGFPVFDYYWAPLHEIDDNASHLEKYFRLFKKLSPRAKWFINACDYDIEGSVIGFMIINYFGDLKRASRAVFSTLTDTDIRRAFARLSPLDTEMVEAGLARHELDWVWGINVSRALMLTFRVATGMRVVLSAGRVQSPTLIELVDRDYERNTFVPFPRFRIEALLALGPKRKRIVIASVDMYTEAERLRALLAEKRYLVVKSVERRRVVLPPPPPFNLGDLQLEASRVYGLTPIATQNIAEKLYLDALISYPRTNSQKIPPSIDVKSILAGLAKINQYREHVLQLLRRGTLRPRQGSKTDPAHPAIHPTGIVPRGLGSKEWKLYDLIVRRFLASLSSPAILRETTLVLRIPGTNIVRRIGFKTLDDPGWTRVYPFVQLHIEQDLEVLREIERLEPGSVVKISRISIRRDFTSPPPAYTRTSIVKWMEGVNIGTEATRARIVETLFNRGYVTSERGKIVVTDLGYAVARLLREYFNDITRVELTRRFEKKIEDIREGKATKKEVVEEAKKLLSSKLIEYRENYLAEASKLFTYFSKSYQGERCSICKRPVYREGLCQYHYAGLESLRTAYIEWKKRIPNIGWTEYLELVKNRRETGKWVKEVIDWVLGNSA